MVKSSIPFFKGQFLIEKSTILMIGNEDFVLKIECIERHTRRALRQHQLEVVRLEMMSALYIHARD